jgi:hypothetical protein
MMMEFFLTAVQAIAAIIGKKILEKNGDKIGTVINEKAEAFLSRLKQQSPEVSTSLENAPETPLNYPQTVANLENVLNSSPELVEVTTGFLEVANKETIPNLEEVILEISEALKAQPNKSDTYINNIEKLVNLAQGNATINIEKQEINL